MVSKSTATAPRPRFRIVATPAGPAWFVWGASGLLRSGLPEPDEGTARERIHAEFPDAIEDRRLESPLAKDLANFFRGKPVHFRVRLDETGLTPFRVRVYRELRKVKAGSTVTYAELARRAGRPAAARGVGQAMRRNPFPPIVPCHRVLTSTGGLGGFSSTRGIDQKQEMLELESQVD
ncbi:MAG: methylated-DNA--[protein]-cysteine S-methyltransferase [Planctomycetes bacterium]|nr:methylated-DNA--[protein]-cysteine S-methyltransferase [Planctomycetota bacterium]